MIRLIGILTGSAVAVAFLIVALGIPEFATPIPAETVPASDPEPEGAVVAMIPEPLLDVPPEPVDPVPEPVDLVRDHVDAVPRPVAAVDEMPEPIEQQWYAFWSPFKSEIAADGFVSQLQRTTGLDYRVVKLKPGVYEVAFAYSDDSDIEDKLTQISSATGLDLSGG